MYSDNYKVPVEMIDGVEYERIQLGHHILLARRKELGMTQQQVSDAAGIQLRQYQRLESGERSMNSASLRIALSVCDVLKLDPHRFVPKVD